MVAVCAATLLPSMATAQLSHPVLRQARASLENYQPSRSLRAIRRLRSTSYETTAVRMEARFLATVAAVDLLVIGERRQNTELKRQVAASFEVADDVLIETLRAELESIEGEVFQPSVVDAIETLAVLAGEQPLRAKRHMGLRQGVLLAHQARRAVRGNSANTLGRLAELADDPCAETCEDIYQPFDERGRRALNALIIAQHITERLEEARTAGDPLSSALMGQIVSDSRAIQGATIRPSPRLPEGATVVSDDAPTAQVDTVIIVRERSVEWGRTPQVRFTERGAELVAQDGPILPETEKITLRGEVTPFPRPIDDVVEMLRSAQNVGTVAVASEPNVQTYVLTRVILSANQAGVAPSMLVAASPDGGIRAMPSNFRSEGARAQRARVQVHVRMGGFEIRTRRGRSDIRGFDLDEVRETLAGGDREHSLVRAMWAADAGPIFAAAFALDAAGMPVDFVTH